MYDTDFLDFRVGPQQHRFYILKTLAANKAMTLLVWHNYQTGGSPSGASAYLPQVNPCVFELFCQWLTEGNERFAPSFTQQMLPHEASSHNVADTSNNRTEFVPVGNARADLGRDLDQDFHRWQRVFTIHPGRENLWPTASMADLLRLDYQIARVWNICELHDLAMGKLTKLIYQCDSANLYDVCGLVDLIDYGCSIALFPFGLNVELGQFVEMFVTYHLQRLWEVSLFRALLIRQEMFEQHVCFMLRLYNFDVDFLES